MLVHNKKYIKIFCQRCKCLFLLLKVRYLSRNVSMGSFSNEISKGMLQGGKAGLSGFSEMALIHPLLDLMGVGVHLQEAYVCQHIPCKASRLREVVILFYSIESESWIWNTESFH